MKLMRQVFSDLWKELGWVLFYGIITSAAIMAIILIGQSYTQVSSHNDAVTQFVENRVTLTRIQGTQYNAPKAASTATPHGEEPESLSSYYGDVFSPQGNAGTYVLMPGRLGFTQVIVLLGQYADFTPFGITPDHGVTFAVSSDLEGQDTISIQGNTWPLHPAPDNMELYHPMFYLTAESGYLTNTLFVFSKDYEAVQTLFPDSEFWELRERELLGRIILCDPAQEDIIRLRRVVSSHTGDYVNVQSIEDYLRSTTATGVRTHQIYLLFFVASALVLLGAMLANLYRILRKKLPDYTIHHLFGASHLWILARMFCFGLLYHGIPLVWTLHMMKLNHLVTPATTGLVIASVWAVVALLVAILFKQYQTTFSQGLRRE